MPNYVDADDERSVEQVAQVLLAIADAEGLPGPVTESGGPKGIRFIVSDELFASYHGAPSKGKDPVESDLSKPQGERESTPRKKKGKK